MITSWMSVAATPPASSAALMAALPSCTAESGERAPRNAPMGVRLADTMTTSEGDMAASFDFVSARQCAADPPSAGAGLDPEGAAARTQAPLEYGDERSRDLRGSQGLVLTIPVSNPVEGPGERKGRHFRVARLDGAVLDTLADQATDPLVDLGLERFDVAAHGGREILVLGPHHAPAEFGADRLTVVTQHGIQPPARRYRQLAYGAERGTDLLDAGHEALEQQLLLAGDVVVHRRLGDLEPCGDVIERGVVVALAVELACCSADHRIALELAIAQPLAVPAPRGSGGGGLARGRRAVTAAVHGGESIIAV